MKIISGGQTGADLGGLEGAKELGFETGGMAPKGYRTEVGPNLKLKTVYGLAESEFQDYAYRTVKNISLADATVIFAHDVGSPGTQLTIKACAGSNKPFLVNPKDSQALRDFCKEHDVKVLNVAGNRESKATGLQVWVKYFIIDTFYPSKFVDDRWIE